MKGQWKGFAMGLISCVLIFSLCNTAFAFTNQQLNATYNNIKIKLYGDIITPKDANGNVVEPFIVDGTTYLPVRAIAEALGLTVNWDSSTQTVLLGDASSNPFIFDDDTPVIQNNGVPTQQPAQPAAQVPTQTAPGQPSASETAQNNTKTGGYKIGET